MLLDFWRCTEIDIVINFQIAGIAGFDSILFSIMEMLDIQRHIRTAQKGGNMETIVCPDVT